MGVKKKPMTWDRAITKVMRLNGKALRLIDIARKCAELKGTTEAKAYGNIAYIIGHDQENKVEGRFERVARGTYVRIA